MNSRIIWYMAVTELMAAIATVRFDGNMTANVVERRVTAKSQRTRINPLFKLLISIMLSAFYALTCI